MLGVNCTVLAFLYTVFVNTLINTTNAGNIPGTRAHWMACQVWKWRESFAAPFSVTSHLQRMLFSFHASDTGLTKHIQTVLDPFTWGSCHTLISRFQCYKTQINHRIMLWIYKTEFQLDVFPSAHTCTLLLSVAHKSAHSVSLSCLCL